MGVQRHLNQFLVRISGAMYEYSFEQVPEAGSVLRHFGSPHPLSTPFTYYYLGGKDANQDEFMQLEQVGTDREWLVLYGDFLNCPRDSHYGTFLAIPPVSEDGKSDLELTLQDDLWYECSTDGNDVWSEVALKKWIEGTSEKLEWIAATLAKLPRSPLITAGADGLWWKGQLGRYREFLSTLARPYVEAYGRFLRLD